MRPGRQRRLLAASGRLIAGGVILASASGRLPHLVVTQAVLSSLLAMVAAPLVLLDRDPARGRPRWSPHPALALVMMSAASLSLQAPPVVAAIGDGGLPSALALAGFGAVAVAFWSVVLPPARLRGLPGAAYVIAGSLPISMPAMFLLTIPRDIYAGFHASAASPLPGLEDQIYAGFVLFASVKVTMFVAFTVMFLSAFAERAEGGGGEDDGDRFAGDPPALPGWVRALLRGEPTVEEPGADLPEPARVPTGAGSR